MMKLYYAPGACSISPQIALREAGLPFELVRVDFMRGKSLPDGRAFTEVNPKGYVPALELPDGQILTEGAAMVQYIADLAPESRLAPPAGSFERVRLQEWLNFIATELHKASSVFFSRVPADEYKASVKERMAARLAFLEQSLGDKKYLFGDVFTIADGYALYALRVWRRIVKGELSPRLAAYEAAIVERPSVKASLEAEGLTGS
jgi:glutathione S-transferase